MEAQPLMIAFTAVSSISAAISALAAFYTLRMLVSERALERRLQRPALIATEFSIVNVAQNRFKFCINLANQGGRSLENPQFLVAIFEEPDLNTPTQIDQISAYQLASGASDELGIQYDRNKLSSESATVLGPIFVYFAANYWDVLDKQKYSTISVGTTVITKGGVERKMVLATNTQRQTMKNAISKSHPEFCPWMSTK